LVAVLEAGFLSSHPGDPTQTDAFRYAREKLVTILASGGTETMLRQASLIRPTPGWQRCCNPAVGDTGPIGV
jgi:hypothetical protein